ncbi:hypothetical protein HELRODRAFT_69115 [Helobdella robusta]|uniref:Transcription initiation factor TFIID subunit 10 n=1 Tax=Helobdella robusta TaxID=6412 RepID=T1FZP7_HELRO|nr:hypothetical protein HELRODRAFT_69115 [Helobdella robusta]ESN94160.1 hypothetical protein HELRODRAFT_69115 [Helobdella robusta]
MAEGTESITNFVMQLDETPTIIPDVVTSSFLNSAGFEASDPRLVKLVSLAGQKFIAEIVNDALQHCRVKSSGQNKKQSKDKKLTLTMEDLSPALADHGIHAVKPPYCL